MRVGLIRCASSATERHHRLPRARGGRLLDATASAAHLAHLCSECHVLAHAHPASAHVLVAPSDRLGQLAVVDGYATTAPDGRVVYVGSDWLLTFCYGRGAA